MKHRNQLTTVNPPLPSPAYRVGDVVYDASWRKLNISSKKGWKCVKIGDKWVGVSSLPDKTGDSFPVYYGYVFKGSPGNWWMDYVIHMTGKGLL